MTSKHHHWLTCLYPVAWRERYGDEMDALIEQEGGGWRQLADVARAALIERFRPSIVGVQAMQTYPGSVATLVRKPSALIPIAMSAAALATVLAAVEFFGARHQPDEGAAAHIFQILIAGQLPFLAWFVLHWLKADSKGVVAVLALQIAAIAVALFPVWYFAL